MTELKTTTQPTDSTPEPELTAVSPGTETDPAPTAEPAPPSEKKTRKTMSLKEARASVGRALGKNVAKGMSDEEGKRRAVTWAFKGVLPFLSDADQRTLRKELLQLSPPPPLTVERIPILINKRAGENPDRDTLKSAIGWVMGIIHRDERLAYEARQELLNVARSYFPKITLEVVKEKFEQSNDALETATCALEQECDWEETELSAIDEYVRGQVQTAFTKKVKSEIELKYALQAASEFVEEIRRNDRRNDKRPRSGARRTNGRRPSQSGSQELAPHRNQSEHKVGKAKSYEPPQEEIEALAKEIASQREDQDKPMDEEQARKRARGLLIQQQCEKQRKAKKAAQEAAEAAAKSKAEAASKSKAEAEAASKGKKAERKEARRAA